MWMLDFGFVFSLPSYTSVSLLPMFFNRLLQGEDLDIDNFIDEWHEGFLGYGPYPALHEFLGMTWDEFAQYIKGEDLHKLVENRKTRS